MTQRRLTLSIHPLFWVFAAVLGYLWSRTFVGTLIWIVVILVSVIVHEMGHALTGLLFKQRCHIQLVMFGGATSREGPKISLWKEFLLTLNGPLFGFALGGVAFGLLHVWSSPPALVLAMLRWFVLVNFFWSIVNLFPILPLDGGHLLRIILEAIFGARGTPIALLVGVVLGTLVTIAAFITGYFIAGAIFFLLTFESLRGWMAYRHVAETDRDENLQQLFRQSEASMQAGDVEQAIAGFQRVRDKTGKGLLYAASTEMLAHLLASKGDEDKAYEYLKEVKKRLSPQTLPLLQKLAYSHGDYETVVSLAKECFQISPSYNVAWLAALAHAARHEAKPAVGWLECALREGLPDAPSALQDPKLDPIREDPHFQELTKKSVGTPS